AKTISGHGNGAVAGFVDAVRKETGLDFDLADYREHALGTGANATAVAYVELRRGDGTALFGVGIDRNIVAASLKAVVSGVNRMLKKEAGAVARSREVHVQAEPASARSAVAQALRQGRGLDLPPKLEAEFQRLIEVNGVGAAPDRICQAFEAEYLDRGRYAFIEHSAKADGGRRGEQAIKAKVTAAGRKLKIEGW